MCRNHILYKNKILLSLCILFCIKIRNVQCQTKLFHSHKTPTFDDYDITTIYKITNPLIFNNTNAGFKNDKFLATFKGNYSIEIHSGTNAIGIPIQVDGFTLSTNDNELFNEGSFQNNSRLYISYIDQQFWEKQRVKLNGHNCEYEVYDHYDKHNNLVDITQNDIANVTGDYCYTALEFMYYAKGIDHWKHHTMLSLVLTPDRNVTCLTITFIHRLISFMEIEMSILDDSDELIISTPIEKHDDIFTLKIDDLKLKNGVNYRVVFKGKFSAEYYYYYASSKYRGIWFALYQIALGSKYDEDNIQRVTINNLESYPKPFGVIGKESSMVYENSTSTEMCRNGGFTQSNKFQCICPPGFTGQFCEKACGANSYKADCQGVCSLHPGKMCRGVLMCKRAYGCTCPPGLTGPLCNDDCKPGTYGNNCTQTCSSNCLESNCNKYTGACSLGCAQGYIAPTCQRKYPYLINPPTLQSNNFEELIFDLNFQSDNIMGGDDNLKMKYYALSYKTLSEKEYNKSQLKFMDENINVTQEIISDLLPETKYNVGVLIVTDDGNFNDQDVVYGEYKTSCVPPRSLDYNLEILSEIKSVNISWKKIIPKRLECNITGYVLTLTYHKSQNQTSGVQEVVTTLENSYIFDDLYPGHSYSVFMTPKTTEGLLPSSPKYFFTTHSTENEVKIKDVVTTFKNKTLIVTWKLTSLYDDDEISTANKSVVCVIKYKIIRNLSCSLKQINDKWVTLQYSNMTELKIYTFKYNTQYAILIGIAVNGSNDIQNEITINSLTPSSEPEIEPTIDLEHPIIVTNHSVFFQWKFDPIKDCSKLNGVFSNYRVELKDKISNDILLIKETKMKHFTFDQLKPNTTYELKVFVKTHVGYNMNYFLLTNFTTKIEMLNAVDELVVYKKDQQNNTVGLRWSYLEENKLDGFIVSIDTFNHSPSNETVIPLTKCSAWPKYYCYTINDLTPNVNYTFKIKPKSSDNLKDGKELSISFDNFEGKPDAPTNLKATEINSTAINLQWDIPFILNSCLRSFYINIKQVSSVNKNTCCRDIPPFHISIDEEVPTYNHTLANLEPGSTYTVSVSTMSKGLFYSSNTPMIHVKTHMKE